MTTESNRPGNSTDSSRWDVTISRRRAVALARWVTIGSLGLMVSLWLAIYASTTSVRNAALDRAASAVSNLSAAFREQVSATLDTINAAMDLTANDLRADPAGFRLDRWSEKLPALARPTMYASLLDAKGWLISTTVNPGLSGVDLSDRDHIKVHFGDHDPGLVVSVPLIGRASGRQTIQVSRRVNDASGHILGILVFSLAADDLTALHRLVDLGPRGVIALVGVDGKLRVRFGYKPEGTSLSPGAEWPIMPDRDSYQGIVTSDAVDGVSRIYSYRRLQTYPLIVAAGLALDDELSEARTHAILVIGIGVAASFLLAALNALLVREIGRRDQRETELANEHAALEAARAEILGEQAKLAAVNKELMLSTERAEAANRAKSQFLAQMSHELRTPLHAVIGFSELIAHHVAPLPSGGQIAGFADDILKSGRHLLELINSILDLSKVESGTASLDNDVVSLGEVIEDSVTTIRERALETGVAVNTWLPETAPRVRGDTTKLRQIFINLLSNAVKFTPRGGSVTVSGRQEPGGGFVVIVTDTGIGMTEPEMRIAMEPFGQVENSLSRSFEGTGPGLPLARRMTELHDGRLTLYSTKGVGTTVEIWLPEIRILWPDGAAVERRAPLASD